MRRRFKILALTVATAAVAGVGGSVALQTSETREASAYYTRGHWYSRISYPGKATIWSSMLADGNGDLFCVYGAKSGWYAVTNYEYLGDNKIPAGYGQSACMNAGTRNPIKLWNSSVVYSTTPWKIWATSESFKA